MEDGRCDATSMVEASDWRGGVAVSICSLEAVAAETGETPRRTHESPPSHTHTESPSCSTASRLGISSPSLLYERQGRLCVGDPGCYMCVPVGEIETGREW